MPGEQRVERDPDREQEVVVGRAQAGGEPGEAGGHHQRARAVGRSPPPREQARADERPAHDQAERRRQAGIVYVVAVQRDRDDDEPADEPSQADEEEPAPRHAADCG
jgi:hypothetical protein